MKNLAKSSHDHIRAHQVIDSVSAVVKELVENSIDAHATQIVVTMQGFGFDAIQVSDNGVGISEEDLVNNLAHKNSTSKNLFSDEKSVGSFGSFGFRGEALFALGCISNLTVISRTESSLVGVKLSIDGDLRKTDYVPHSVGTSVYANNLFWNLPIRRKELQKSIKTQFSNSVSLLKRFVLLFNNIKFVLYNNRECIFSYEKSERIVDRIISVYNFVEDEMIEIDGCFMSSSVFGYVNVNAKKVGKENFFLYVNEKIFSCKKIVNKIKNALSTIIEGGLFCLLHLKIDKRHVLDYNVATDKTKIVLKDEELLFDEVAKIVLQKVESRPQKQISFNQNSSRAEQSIVECFETPLSIQPQIKPPPSTKTLARPEVFSPLVLRQASNAPEVIVSTPINNNTANKITPMVLNELDTTTHSSSDTSSNRENVHSTSFASAKIQRRVHEPYFKESQLLPSKLLDFLELNSKKNDFELTLPSHFDKKAFNSFEVVGQFNKAFIICTLNEHVYIVDQHAADEKANYERLMSSYRLTSQDLLQGKDLEQHLSKENFQLVSQEPTLLRLFNNANFPIKVQDGQLFSNIIIDKSILVDESNFNQVIDEIKERNLFYRENELKVEEIQCCMKKIKHIMATKACRMSVMFGDALDIEKMKLIVKKLSTLEKPFNCPHGRPTFRHLYTFF